MNFKYKTIFFDRTPHGLLLSVIRVVCLVAMAYFMGQAIVTGVRTLGAIIYSLFPVVALGGILLLLEIQKENLSLLFSLPALSDIKASKKYLPLFIVFLIGAVLLVFYSRINFAVDLVIVLLIIIAAFASVILMLKNQGVYALCIFILAWPLMIFERGFGHVTFHWSRAFNNLGIGIFSDDIVFFFYVLILVFSWLLRVALNRERIKSKSLALGFLFLLIAGLISTIFSFNPQESWLYFINYYLLPVIFFILCVNEINSWQDVKKLSFALAVMMAVVTILWLYYALYRAYEPATSIAEFASLRGGGGTVLGSRYSARAGVYYEFLAPIIIPIALALAFSSARRFKRVIWIGIALLMMMTTLYTFGRVGYILLAFCLLPWFLSSKRGFLVFLVLLVLLFNIHIFKAEVISNLFIRFDPLLSWQTLQDEIRLKLWIGSIQMLRDHPWSGIGIRMFQNYAADYGLISFYRDKLGKRYLVVWSNSHGMFFQMVSELGLPGLIAWCAMLWIPVKRLIKSSISPQSLLSEEKPWITAMKSNALVIIFLFFLGGFGNWGIEIMRICVFILWLAVMHLMDNLSNYKPVENYIH